MKDAEKSKLFGKQEKIQDLLYQGLEKATISKVGKPTLTAFFPNRSRQTNFMKYYKNS